MQPIQLQQAIATLQPIGKDDPLYAPAVLQQANLLAESGQTAQAVAVLDQLIAVTPGTIDPLQEAGDILRGNGQFSQSITYYDRAIALLPQPAPPQAWPLYYDRAISKDQGGNWKAAEADLQTALALSPNQPYVLNYLGYTWALRGENLPQAQTMLQQAVAEMARRQFRHLTILARARNRRHAHLLMGAGITQIVRETFFSSLHLTELVLGALDVPGDTARRAIELFRMHDERNLEETQAIAGDEQKLIQSTQQAAQELLELFESDRRE